MKEERGRRKNWGKGRRKSEQEGEEGGRGEGALRSKVEINL